MCNVIGLSWQEKMGGGGGGGGGELMGKWDCMTLQHTDHHHVFAGSQTARGVRPPTKVAQ